MAFGNFWRGGRERFGERDQERNRGERWRTTGSDWRDDERNRWRDNEQQQREGRYGSSDWESGDYYGERSRDQGGGYGSAGYGSGRQGYGGERYRSQQKEGYGSEYDYRGGSLSGSGFGRGYGSSGGSTYGTGGSSYGTAGSYGSQGRSMEQGMHRGRGPRNYRRSDDRIREDVCDCLTEDDRLDASSMDVAVTEGEVVLSGTVFTREDKRRAEDLVEGISGVKDVRNNLRVSSEQSGQQPGGQTQGQQSSGQPGQSQTGQSPRH